MSDVSEETSLAERVTAELGGGKEAAERVERVIKYALDLLKAEGGDPKVVLAAVQLKPLGVSRAKAILAELETEPEIIEAVVELIKGEAPADDHSRQVYEDVLTLTGGGAVDAARLTTRTAQKLAAQAGG